MTPRAEITRKEVETETVRTPMTQDFRRQGLVTIERLEEYDGTTAVMRTEYLCWKAERWMKLSHMPAAIRYDPQFVIGNAPPKFAHTCRGSSFPLVLGLESSRKVFQTV